MLVSHSRKITSNRQDNSLWCSYKICIQTTHSIALPLEISEETTPCASAHGGRLFCIFRKSGYPSLKIVSSSQSLRPYSSGETRVVLLVDYKSLRRILLWTVEKGFRVVQKEGSRSSPVIKEKLILNKSIMNQRHSFIVYKIATN
jgi:hypothetical protein